jgi:hypothetical protein
MCSGFYIGEKEKKGRIFFPDITRQPASPPWNLASLPRGPARGTGTPRPKQSSRPSIEAAYAAESAKRRRLPQLVQLRRPSSAPTIWLTVPVVGPVTSQLSRCDSSLLPIPILFLAKLNNNCSTQIVNCLRWYVFFCEYCFYCSQGTVRYRQY